MGNKRVTNTTKFILNVWNIGLFALVWLGYYNARTFDTHVIKGGIITVIIFVFIYTAMCDLYKAHRIASSEIGETVFSQILSFGIADAILYIECCFVCNEYVNIFPGVTIVILQILGTICIVVFAKYYFMKYVPAKKTVIVYGKDVAIHEVNAFKQRILQRYGHLFDIEAMICEKEAPKLIAKDVAGYEVAILYELFGRNRISYIACLMEAGKSFYLSPRIEDIVLQGCVPKHLLDTPLMKYDYKYENRISSVLKRATDIIFSVMLLILLSPLLLVIALLIKIEDGGPVLFKQKRCTKDARVFEILKFRSMVVGAEKNEVIPCVDGDTRVTKIGRFIRKTRIDELPQFVNILKGDMSIVGPRPERVEHVEQYSKDIPEFAYRMKVLGGLTGYAQIYGKYNTSAYDKLRLDLLYIENQSFVLDLKLMLLTVRTIFTPESTEGFGIEKSREMQEKARKQIELSMAEK